MRTLHLLSLITILLFATSCSSNSTNNNDGTSNNSQRRETRRKTTTEALTNEGWSELATVEAYFEKSDRMVVDALYTIFYKGEHYIAVTSSDCGKPNNWATRHSVTRGNFRKCGETYSGRISRYGTNLYFNF